MYDAPAMLLLFVRATVRLRGGPALMALVAALALGLAACGGSGDDVDLSKVPTATLPAELPEPIIVGAPVPGGGGRTYTIEAGDTLSAVAEQFDVSVEALMEANEIEDPTRLEVGQVLVIPGTAPSGPFPTPVSPEATPTLHPGGLTPGPGESTYVVQSGDNASAIAERFGITLEELAAVNGVTIDELRALEVGQVLVIPEGAAEPPPEPTEEPVAEPTEEPVPEPTEEPPPP
ncbi:MAG: LysM peptidoglycan-binding domain-containing protein [Dehalococcoidia bacterium]